jgi:hypothetical protein
MKSIAYGFVQQSRFKRMVSDMELTEIARGHLRVKNGAKSVTVYGEALLRFSGAKWCYV